MTEKEEEDFHTGEGEDKRQLSLGMAQRYYNDLGRTPQERGFSISSAMIPFANKVIILDELRIRRIEAVYQAKKSFNMLPPGAIEKLLYKNNIAF